MRCPCGSLDDFDRCCGPYLAGEKAPPTAEALMRSRYTAYTLGDIDYVGRTLAPESHGGFDARAAKAWASEAKWLGLRVMRVERGRTQDDVGVVEFVASYRQRGRTIAHRELSRFRKLESGEWRFVEGDAQAEEKPEPQSPSGPKVGRNDPCPCGSGKKYKKCCGA